MATIAGLERSGVDLMGFVSSGMPAVNASPTTTLIEMSPVIGT